MFTSRSSRNISNDSLSYDRCIRALGAAMVDLLVNYIKCWPYSSIYFVTMKSSCNGSQISQIWSMFDSPMTSKSAMFCAAPVILPTPAMFVSLSRSSAHRGEFCFRDEAACSFRDVYNRWRPVHISRIICVKTTRNSFHIRWILFMEMTYRYHSGNIRLTRRIYEAFRRNYRRECSVVSFTPETTCTRQKSARRTHLQMSASNADITTPRSIVRYPLWQTILRGTYGNF